MRAKTVKFCENPFLHAEEGCTLCPCLVDISSHFKTDFFCIGTLCFFVVTGGTVIL